MPFVITQPRRGSRVVLAAVGAAAALAFSATPALADTAVELAALDAPTEEIAVSTATSTETQAAATPEVASVCTTPSFSKPFRLWGDFNDYTLAPGGDMEDGAPGWTLDDGAEIVEGNNWFRVGDRSDDHSLRLRSGASALSAPMCIDDTYSSFRFFARRAVPSSSDLRVDVLWWESGATHSARVTLDRFAGLLWAPVRPIDLPAAHLSAGGHEPIQFRFTVTGHSGAWLLDDVYVDPFSRG
ncbi:MAG TPA: hypothetical protein VN213_09470 [Solirubrobacteraceae bacterium]|nr:hypothetical protein [Solirubrobacteraceae bacterium]